MNTNTCNHDNVSINLNENEAKVECIPGKSENISLLPKGKQDTSHANSREFVEKIDEILSSTSKLIINLSEKAPTCEPFKSSGVTSVFQVFNAGGDHVFTIGRCPLQQNIQTIVISNSIGYGLMIFSTKGVLNRVCDVEGAGLLSFTQIQQILGGYTLRDPYKELVKIRCSWIPFCTCCLVQPISTATIAITDLDGTPNGKISFTKELNMGCGDSSLCFDFIPNLNPKAKYMLFAAGIKILYSYFSESERKNRSRCLIIFYLLLVIILLIVCPIIINIMTRYIIFCKT